VRAFASYAQRREEDMSSVGRIVAELRLRGLTTFHDRGSFVAGDPIEDRIARELALTSVYVPFLNPEALASPAVTELEFKPAARLARAGRLQIAAAVARLGKTHAEITERSWPVLAYPFDARWTRIVHGEAAISDEEAAAIAACALRAALRPSEGPGDGSWHLLVATRGDRPTAEQLVVDATEFLGGESPRPGTPTDWRRVWNGLCDLAAVLKEHGRRRDVVIEPCCHLTGAVAAGYAFRCAAQWRPSVVGEDGSPCLRALDREHPELSITCDHGSLTGNTLTAEIGLLPQPIAPAVERTLASSQPPRRRLLVERREHSRRMGAADLAVMAGTVADRLKRERNDCGATRVEIFMAAPAAFAVLFGAELGGVGCPVRLHEHTGDRYVFTLELETT
jgi:hypothetical protein